VEQLRQAKESGEPEQDVEVRPGSVGLERKTPMIYSLMELESPVKGKQVVWGLVN